VIYENGGHRFQGKLRGSMQNIERTLIVDNEVQVYVRVSISSTEGNAAAFPSRQHGCERFEGLAHGVGDSLTQRLVGGVHIG
jgi:hypothetical protein